MVVRAPRIVHVDVSRWPKEKKITKINLIKVNSSECEEYLRRGISAGASIPVEILLSGSPR